MFPSGRHPATLLPSMYADARYIDAVIVSQVGTLDRLRLAHDAWDWRGVPQPQPAAYLRWLKAHLIAQEPVVWFVMCKGDSHNCSSAGSWDHIEVRRATTAEQPQQRCQNTRTAAACCTSRHTTPTTCL